MTFTAMPKRAALTGRTILVRLVETYKQSPRQNGQRASGTIIPEIDRIARNLARILRATATQEHSALWACFGSTARQHQEIFRVEAEEAIAERCV